MAATETAREYTAADVKAWREGWWYFLSLAGRTVYRHHTRNDEYTTAWAIFSSNRSPNYPKTDRYYQGVLLGKDYRSGWSYSMRNSIEVPIQRGSDG